jgi:hypothetical protein
MDSMTLINEIKKSWTSFYSFKEIRKRANRTRWPMTGKIWYMLACFGFRLVYAGYGLSADSVKTKKMAFFPSLMLKSAVSFYNRFFRTKTSAPSAISAASVAQS